VKTRLKRRPMVPWWVRAITAVSRFIEYNILSAIDRKLLYWRIALWDDYCTCHRCQERGWKPYQQCYCYECVDENGNDTRKVKPL
jgi:hypothetical protein